MFFNLVRRYGGPKHARTVDACAHDGERAQILDDCCCVEHLLAMRSANLLVQCPTLRTTHTELRISELSWNVAAVLSAGGNPLRPHGSPVMSPSQSATLPFPSAGKLNPHQKLTDTAFSSPFK